MHSSRWGNGLRVYDLLGKELATLVSGNLPAGLLRRLWNAGEFSSGVYFYQLKAGGGTLTGRMIYQR
jgi:hypothetical protein